MNEIAVWSLLPACLFLLGGLMLWLASWRQQRRSGANPFARPSLFLTFFGWAGLVLGAIGLAVTTSFFFAPLVLLAGAVILVAGVIRYWRSEYRYLIWSLAEAAERGIPLEKAARAFAGERSGGIGSSARRLADYLDAAVPLSVAMVRSGIWVSPEIRMAADMGEKTGTLDQSLKKAIEHNSAFDNTLGSVLAKFFYLSAILSVMLLVVTFMMIQIVPTFAEMFEEFEMQLPATTQLLISVSRIVVQYWFLLFPLFLLFAAAIVLGLLMFVGVPFQSLPVVRYLLAPIDNAAVLNSLAIAVQQKQSITDNLLLLSGVARSPRSRQRLAAAIDHIESGAHWTEALRAAGLITKPQAGVIRSAERAGNLSWALNEMADSTIRLTAHRTQGVLSFVFPACLVVIGFCVLFVVIGMMLPLFDLIGNLA